MTMRLSKIGTFMTLSAGLVAVLMVSASTVVSGAYATAGGPGGWLFDAHQTLQGFNSGDGNLGFGNTGNYNLGLGACGLICSTQHPTVGYQFGDIDAHGALIRGQLP